MRLLRSLFHERRVLGGTAILALTQVAASVAGLLRDRLLNQTFPREVTDAYFAAFRPSDFLFQACILSALGTVFVPVLASRRAHGSQGGMDRLLSAVLHVAAVVFGVIAGALALLLPFLAPTLVQFEGEQLSLYVTFARLALLSNLLFVFGTTFGQYLITTQRFWIYGLTPILYTAGTIAGTIVLTPSLGPLGPMAGTLAGAAVYALLRWWDVLRAGGRLVANVWWDAEFRSMGILMLPRALALGAIQLQLLVFDAVGSGLGSGVVTVNAAARNFQSVVVGAIGIALAQAVYAPLSEASARGEMGRYRRYLSLSLLWIALLTIPAGVILVLLSPVAASLVGLHSSLAIFTPMLALYALSIPLESANHVLLRAFYARRATLIPAIAAAANGIVAIAVSVLGVASIGILALPAAFIAGHATQAALLGWAVRRKGSGNG
ncbi:MAG: virulence factor [Candidatus Peregrinibacteria bacterium Gr01-1014_25]|nr:MAG: virulence factor [Candidatus Peregrinibacteria bacterium Gr01-1014_25]